MPSLAELVALLNRRRRENQDNDYQGEYFDPQAYNDNQSLLTGTGTPGLTVFEREAEDSLRRQNRNSTPVGPVYPGTTDFGYGEQGKTLFDRDSEDLLRRRNMYGAPVAEGILNNVAGTAKTGANQLGLFKTQSI